jgi:riboflavin biosynthesis pyrimidine reductase
MRRVTFDRLVPGGDPVPAAEALAAARLGALAGPDRPYVFMNFVSTLDGRAALDGSTRPLGGPADLAMLLALRDIADAVLIGPGTVRAEGYARLVGDPERRAAREAAGLSADPPAVLISRRFIIPWEAGLFAAPSQPVIVYTSAEAAVVDAPPVAAPVEVVRLAECTPAHALADLRARGIRALLSEGGPTLFNGLLAAGLVDELFLTLTPVLTADHLETPILSGPRLAAPVRSELRWLLRSGHELFLRYAILE